MRRPFTPAHSYLLSTSSASLSTLFSFLSYELGSERSSTSRTLREGAIDIYRMLSHDDHRYDRELCFAIVLRPSPICRYRSDPAPVLVNRVLGGQLRTEVVLVHLVDRQVHSVIDHRRRYSCTRRKSASKLIVRMLCGCPLHRHVPKYAL